ncbi:MAG: outer membrane beta-barrel protein [Candidatus Aminicenantaceae bacterium]
MKKSIIFFCLFWFIFGSLRPAFSEESGRGFSISLNVGASPVVWFYNSYRFGGEIGYQFTKHFGVMTEFAYGFTKYSSQSEGMYYSSSSETSFTIFPINLSLLYFLPVNRGFVAFVGLGGGHYSLSIKEESEVPGYSNQEKKSETNKLKAFAPHFCLGFEGGISKRLAVFGEVKHFIGKAKLKKTDQYGYSSEQDIFFGGPHLKIGIRLYFKD